MVDHELVGPKFKAKAENFQVIKKDLKNIKKIYIYNKVYIYIL